MAAESDVHAQMLSNRLFGAIQNNNIERVRVCIDQGVDVRINGVYSQEIGYMNNVCPLALACCLGYEEIMLELLKTGANPNDVSGKYHQPAMHLAADEGAMTLSMLRSLIAYGADVALKDGAGKTILLYLISCKFNDSHDNLLSAVKLVVDRGACFYDQTHVFTPLFWACRSGRVDIVKLFIDEGADVCVRTGNMTMLSIAARGCNIDMLDLIVNAGADRLLRPDDLIVPCSQNNHAMVERILDTCDVDINMTLRALCPGMTILHYSCDNDKVTNQMIRCLLNHGADIRAVSVTGDTALHYVLKHGDCSKIRQLLSYHHPLNIKNNENQTPIAKLIHNLRHAHTMPEHRTNVFVFKMLVTAGAKLTADFDHELKQISIKHLDTAKSNYEISSSRSLKEICRLVIRGTITVPVDASLCKLPIPIILQQYLNFPEFVN